MENINIAQSWFDFCLAERVRNLGFEPSVLSYRKDTLFCPAGMQKYLNEFEQAKDSNFEYPTVTNIQPVIRMNDLEEIGDGSHLLYFNMIGLFSFNHWSMKNAVSFFYFWVKKELGLIVDFVTIHPDKQEWRELIVPGVQVREDNTNIWQLGDIKGYCLEFYVIRDGIEIEVGNIVNPHGTCIDVGFGLERLDSLVNGTVYDEERVLFDTIGQLLKEVTPSSKGAGYVLRKLMRIAMKKNILIPGPVGLSEKDKYHKMFETYEKHKNKHKDKNSTWWRDTYGVEVEDL